MRPAHFYHVYADGDWRICVDEHRGALAASEFTGDCYAVIIGSAKNRAEARKCLPGFTIAREAARGFEQETLDELHLFARHSAPETPILYAHTKGSNQHGFSQELWRRCMTQACVNNWSACVDQLFTHDTAGIHLTRAPGPKIRPLVYAGNFWWANAGYLAELPPITYECAGHHGPCPSEHACRWAAEAWIGLNKARAWSWSGVEDRLPLHPHELAEPEPTVRPTPAIGLVSRVGGESGVNRMKLR